MRLKRLTFAVIGVVLTGAALLAKIGQAKPVPFVDLTNVQSILVNDDTIYYIFYSRRITHANFTLENGAWKENVSYSDTNTEKVQGHWQRVTSQKTVSRIVPNSVLRKVFDTLNHVPPPRRTRRKIWTIPDIFRHTTLTFRTPSQTVTYHSDSHTTDGTPWQVTTAGGNFVAASDAPYTALLLLRPYLHEDKLKTMEQQSVKPRSSI